MIKIERWRKKMKEIEKNRTSQHACNQSNRSNRSNATILMIINPWLWKTFHLVYRVLSICSSLPHGFRIIFHVCRICCKSLFISILLLQKYFTFQWKKKKKIRTKQWRKALFQRKYYCRTLTKWDELNILSMY